MTYNVPDPANESPDRVAPDPTAPTLSSVVGPDGSGVEQAAADDPPLPNRRGAPADDFGPLDSGPGADDALPAMPRLRAGRDGNRRAARAAAGSGSRGGGRRGGPDGRR